MKGRMKFHALILVISFLMILFAGCSANQATGPTPAAQASDTPAASSTEPQKSETPAPSSTEPQKSETPAPSSTEPQKSETPAPSSAGPQNTDTPAPSPADPENTATPKPSKTPEPMKLEEYQDIRRINANIDNDKADVSNMDLTKAGDILPTLWYNNNVVWPDKSLMPTGFDPDEVMDSAKNPGLGVRELHSQGITGKGVNVAIIDQPLFDDHPEFTGKIAAYKDFDCGSDTSMHGPAVTSLLVGENTGTAPGARVYYAAAPSWLQDAQYYADALNWIIDENSKLPEGQKIRVVSVSAAPSGEGSPFLKNNDSWDEAVKKAEEEGMIVLDCTSDHGFVNSCYLNEMDKREDPSGYKAGFPGSFSVARTNGVSAPTSPRTTAEEYTKGIFCYQYMGRGGLSWAIPYCAGVMAMGWQVRPDLTGAEMKELLIKSAYGSERIINPPEFIKMAKEYKK